MTLKIKVATTETELKLAFELRCIVFGEELSYINIDKFPDRKEKDNFDDLSVVTNFIAKRDDKIVGTIRLVEPSDLKFNIEKYVCLGNLKKESKIVLAEASRFCIAKSERKSRDISYGLCKIIINYSHLKGITDLCTLANATNTKEGNTVKFFEKMGLYQFSDRIYIKEFNEYAIPMNLTLNNISEPMRSWLIKPSPFIEKPYDRYRENI